MKKFKFKRDIWGVIFSAGVGFVTWMIYDLGKITGKIDICEDIMDDLEEVVKAGTKENIEG